jgi:RNA polymerase I-specific transcription initiation factor RRN3
MVQDDKPQSGQFPVELQGFQRVLLSKFAPLKVCADAIVQEFSKITLQLNIMYCYSISTKADIVKQETQTMRLDTFFPFDPLPLLKSKELIQEYQEWDQEDDESELASLPAVSSELGTSFQGMSLDDKVCMSVSFG